MSKKVLLHAVTFRSLINCLISDDRDSRESTPDPKNPYYRDLETVSSYCTEDSLETHLIDTQKEVIECLSIALAQVAHSVDNKYLKKPLGN